MTVIIFVSVASYDPDYGYDEFGREGGRDSGYSTHGQEFSYDTTGGPTTNTTITTDPLAATPAGHRSTFFFFL